MGQAYHRDVRAMNKRFVHRVSVVKAVPFYGYALGWQLFVKVEVLNPSYVFKCAEMLTTGLMGAPMQPHESHIPFLLAFMADYNLNGCDWLEFESYTNRDAQTRIAYSGEEIDINVQDILNRRLITEGTRHGILFEQAQAGVKIASLKEVWASDAARRVRLKVSQYAPPPDPSPRTHNDHWETWERNQSLLGQRIAEDTETVIAEKSSYDNVPSIFESIRSTRVQSTPVKHLAPTQVFRLPKRRTTRSEVLTQPDTTQSQKTQPDIRSSAPSASLNSSINFKDSPPSKRSRLLPPSPQRYTREDSILAAKDASEMLKGSFAMASRPLGIEGAALKYFAPRRSEVVETFGITAPRLPFFSDKKDVSLFPFLFAGKEYHLKSHDPGDLKPFRFSNSIKFNPLAVFIDQTEDLVPSVYAEQELKSRAPPRSEVVAWSLDRIAQSQQITSSRTFFAASLGAREDVVEDLSILALEIHVQTRSGKVPFAKEDAISAVFWRLSAEKQPIDGIISTSPVPGRGNDVVLVDTELELLDQVIAMVRHFDPDVLCGYETNNGSWGYLNVRYTKLVERPIYDELGRVKDTTPRGVLQGPVYGRHMLSLWNLLRKEANLRQYTLEHVVFHTLHERTPHYSFDNLTKWWDSGVDISTVAEYWTTRTEYNIRLLNHFEIIGRYCAQARIIGVDFWSALTRGSQYMVESVMTRLARRENFVFVSPSKRQVAQQNALEFIPLVMEPLSAFYTDPVCVLDFRSLYPSIVIAYNLCYSTCIGRVDLWRGKNKLGILSDLKVPPGVLKSLGPENIYVAPNGMGYVVPEVRSSLLAHMLSEILETRFMINDSRKKNKDDLRYQRNLNNQQLALKFIANVTYGYTSASFSGRMPCAELADSIVLTGREILVRSIEMIEACDKWSGVSPKVVYGDTDSLFVQLPKVTREQAFRIGKEIADMITLANRSPILLKLEKVYDPCILQTKKRYVGRAFEPGSTTPFFDAKGTETVRRDGTPIVQKTERRALELLFEGNHDLSRVKQYLQNQFRRILTGKVAVQEFCFAQEVKLGTYKSDSLAKLPGGAVVSLKKLAKDEGALPQYRERVPFVVTAGAPGSRIVDRCVSPEAVLNDPNMIIDYDYYILQTIIPPLERLFNMLGANIRDWYTKMPRGSRLIRGHALHGHVTNRVCAVCLERPTTARICGPCLSNPDQSTLTLLRRQQAYDQRLVDVMSICKLCSGRHSDSCVSLDCPIFYERKEAEADAEAQDEVKYADLFRLLE